MLNSSLIPNLLFNPSLWPIISTDEPLRDFKSGAFMFIRASADLRCKFQAVASSILKHGCDQMGGRSSKPWSWLPEGKPFFGRTEEPKPIETEIESVCCGVEPGLSLLNGLRLFKRHPRKRCSLCWVLFHLVFMVQSLFDWWQFFYFCLLSVFSSSLDNPWQIVKICAAVTHCNPSIPNLRKKENKKLVANVLQNLQRGFVWN